MGQFDPNGLAHITREQDAEMTGSRVHAGDVLLNITGASIGRVCVAPDHLVPANVNQHVCIIRSDGSWLPHFLCRFLSTPEFQRFILSDQAGATRQALTKTQIEDFSIPLPPLAEQKWIAERLTEQLAAVGRARGAAQSRLAAAEALPAAYLREVFEGPETSGWETYTLGDLVRTPIHTGISKPGRPDSNKYCLTLSAVRGRTLLLEANKPAELSDAEAEGNWLRPGCFYVVRGNGNRDLVGRGAFAPDPMPKRVLFPDLLFQLDLGERVDPSFFWCRWSSASVRRDIEERARTAAGIYKINTGNLNSLPLSLPPLPDQRRIAADLAARLAGAERLAEGIRAELAEIEALPAALLREAFGGGAPGQANIPAIA